MTALCSRPESVKQQSPKHISCKLPHDLHVDIPVNALKICQTPGKSSTNQAKCSKYALSVSRVETFVHGGLSGGSNDSLSAGAVHIWNTDLVITPLIARFMRPTWRPSGADRTQVGPMLAPWTLLSGSVWWCGAWPSTGTMSLATTLDFPGILLPMIIGNRFCWSDGIAQMAHEISQDGCWIDQWQSRT